MNEAQPLVKAWMNLRNVMLGEQKPATLCIKSKSDESWAIKHLGVQWKKTRKCKIQDSGVVCGAGKRMDWEEHREGHKLLFMFWFLGWAVSSLASLFCYLKYEQMNKRWAEEGQAWNDSVAEPVNPVTMNPILVHLKWQQKEKGIDKVVSTLWSSDKN